MAASPQYTLKSSDGSTTLATFSDDGQTIKISPLKIYSGDVTTTTYYTCDSDHILRGVSETSGLTEDLYADEMPSISADTTFYAMLEPYTIYLNYTLTDDSQGVKAFTSSTNMEDCNKYIHNTLGATNLKKAFVYGNAKGSTVDSTSGTGFFEGCTNLEDFSCAGVRFYGNSTNHYHFCYGCSKLTYVSAAMLGDISSTTQLGSCFYNCTGLLEINLGGWYEWLFSGNLYSLTDFENFCGNCTSLQKVTLCSPNPFKTSSLDTQYMFLGCSALTTIYCSSDWSSYIKYDTMMFYGCTSLVGGISYDSSKVGKTYACPETGYFTDPSNHWRPIQPGDHIEAGETIRIYATQAYVNAGGTMFDWSGECLRCVDEDGNGGLFFTAFDGGGAGLINQAEMDDETTYWFNDTSQSLPATLNSYIEINTEIGVTIIDTSTSSGCADMIYVKRDNYSGLATFSYTKTDNTTGSITISGGTTLDQISNYITDYIGRTNLKTATLSGILNGYPFDYTDESCLFGGCTNLQSLDVSNSTLGEYVGGFEYAFADCDLTTLDLSSWDVSRLSNLEDMFEDSNITTLNINGWTPKSAVYMQGMFGYGVLETIYCDQDWLGYCYGFQNGYEYVVFYGASFLKGAISYSDKKLSFRYANPTSGYFTATGYEWRKIKAGDIIRTQDLVRIYCTQAFLDSYTSNMYRLTDYSGTAIQCVSEDGSDGFTNMAIYHGTVITPNNAILLQMDDSSTYWMYDTTSVIPTTLNSYVETTAAAFTVNLTSVSGDIADMIYIYRPAEESELPVYFCGNQLNDIYFNGTKISHLYFNGTQIV